MRKIIVCDDVELERQLLKDILHEYFEEIHEEICVEEYSSGEVLVADAEEDTWRENCFFWISIWTS